MYRQGYARVVGAATGVASGIAADWFGDGSDGDLVIPAGTDYVITVAEDTGHIFKQYRNVTIEVGATLRPSHRCNGMLILVSGNLVVNGTISMDKLAPLWDPTEEYVLESAQIRLCNIMGGDGGSGGRVGAAIGGRGGLGHALGGGYGGGGGGEHSYWGSSNGYRNGGDSEPRPPYGIPWPYQETSGGTAGKYGCGGSASSEARGGAAPGGGGAAAHRDSSDTVRTSHGKAGDAYGGGALWIFVKGSVRIGGTGKITACGGKGGAYAYIQYYNGIGASGGGGGGGAIAIVYGGTYTNAGTLVANAGSHGQSANTGMWQDESADGAVGTILVSRIHDLVA